MYKNILRNNLSAEEMGLKDNFVLMQDNEPKQNATNTKAWILTMFKNT